MTIGFVSVSSCSCSQNPISTVSILSSNHSTEALLTLHKLVMKFSNFIKYRLFVIKVHSEAQIAPAAPIIECGCADMFTVLPPHTSQLDCLFVIIYC